MRYLRNLGVGISQAANVISGGDPDETVSSRLGKATRRGNRVAKLLCRFLALFDEGHCKGAIESDEGGDAVL